MNKIFPLENDLNDIYKLKTVYFNDLEIFMKANRFKTCKMIE